jgi:hypothetical protein
MADLKLGLLPKQRTVRITVVPCEPLRDERDAHAAEHGRPYEHESVETAALMPHMLEAFIRADCAWCGRQKQKKKALNGRRSIHYRPPDDGFACDDGGR